MEITLLTVQARMPVTIMRLKGTLDSSSAGTFNDQARQVIEHGAQNILLDFSDVTWMSSVGIRSLSAVYNWLHPVNTGEEQKAINQAVAAGTYAAPHLKLFNPNPAIRRTIELVSLDRYLQIFNDEKEALAAF
jgi:anti-anti-sigma factor